MRAARLRLVVAVLLFLGWIAWLGYLALPSVTPREVLSHSQFLVSQLDVIARVEADERGHPAARVAVEEVLWPAGQQDLAGRPLTVTNLSESKGFTGPGAYILPLVRADDAYKVAAAPRSPGYDGGVSSRFPRIYPASEQNRKQQESIPKPEPN
jgi:hypothetical protein